MTWHRANWRFWEERHSSRIVARSSVIPSFPRLSLSASVLIVPRFSTQWRYNYTYETSRLIFQWWSYNIVYLFLSSLIVNCWHFLFFFSFLFCFAREILSYLACTRHAPTDEMFVKERKSRERRSVPLCLVVAILRKRFDGIGKPFFPKKGVRMNATDRVIPRWCLFSIHTSRFIERSVALLRTICCLLFFAFSPTRTNTVRGGGNGASTHCHSYENEN